MVHQRQLGCFNNIRIEHWHEPSTGSKALIAEGHRAALGCLYSEAPRQLILNLGSGYGKSVLDVVYAMEAASNRSTPYAITERRSGDAVISVADPSQALARLCLRTQRGLEAICRDR